ncbi:hypothetical protein CANTEDRAFT_110235 [Yamadazyma tenuis ATCC 10573]|uniref:JmjC domain-containing protein n=1 Tax=Candida tenuis (strain ATCC 10573 / BCRC 21748 / CBS 615 / JCM 9827 / NBRC 10315 / NRRL Y-1498 / VKM Y-70) TaxID=590646 RepID=G3BEC1_CANTC|nr:uncharacterized protein CANTEDRAFT_110235 [Yamadazyma tenuis ATCC 10573]EGV60511.1 hypothetical protein CANTEDRAFT_110235 [Yamadazyma tenuis ATCC 10573]
MIKKTRDPRSIYTRSVMSKHPFGVKPQGNALLEDPRMTYALRKQSLGDLSVLSDDCLMYLLDFIDDIESLKQLMATSKYLFVFTNDEDLWKKRYTSQNKKEQLKWRGSWKRSVLGWNNDIIVNVDLNSEVIYRPFQVANIVYESLFHNLVEAEMNNKKLSINEEGRIPRFAKISQKQFDDIETPFILTDHKWPQWTLEELNSKYGSIKFQQEAVKWPLSTFIEYLQSNKDENPLYLFDCRSEAMTELRKQYQAEIPQVFQEDYFKLLGNHRPDHSWLIVGSKRSGSTFHKDPNNTSAWNACITGKKLWVMLPPHITPPGVSVSEDQSEITSPVGIGEWVLSGFYNDAIKIPEALVGITFPGECMYVPSNWWHLVINLDNSIAITENFVPEKDLQNVLTFFQTRPEQISGFKLNDIKGLINILSCKNQRISEFIQLLEDSSIDLFEDCGELENLPQVPIFDIFKQLLMDNGKEAVLSQILERMKPKRPQKRVWSCISESSTDASPVPFSFNFSVD